MIFSFLPSILQAAAGSDRATPVASVVKAGRLAASPHAARAVKRVNLGSGSGSAGSTQVELPADIWEYVVEKLPLRDICVHPAASAFGMLATAFTKRQHKLRYNLSLEGRQQLILSAGIPTVEWDLQHLLGYLHALVSPNQYALISSTTSYSKVELAVAVCAIWTAKHIHPSMTFAAADAVSELDDPLLLAILGSAGQGTAGPSVSASSQRDSLANSAAQRVIALDRGILYFRMVRDSATAKGDTAAACQLGVVLSGVWRGLLYVQHCLNRVHAVWRIKYHDARVAFQICHRNCSLDVSVSALMAAHAALKESLVLLRTFDTEVIEL